MLVDPIIVYAYGITHNIFIIMAGILIVTVVIAGCGITLITDKPDKSMVKKLYIILAIIATVSILILITIPGKETWRVLMFNNIMAQNDCTKEEALEWIDKEIIGADENEESEEK